jgi:hypothetical protein
LDRFANTFNVRDRWGPRRRPEQSHRRAVAY